MATLPRKLCTPEEYLALEEQAQTKSEYYNGEIYAMAGGSANHNQIIGNLYIGLRQAVDPRPCRVFMTDMRLLVKPSGLYTYPDVMVICEHVEFDAGRTDTVTNPILIIEVLSESTQAYDRTTKFGFYRRIPTLREYVLVDQARAYVEVFRKIESGLWAYEAYDQLEGMLRLDSLELDIPLATIYRRVEWPATNTGAQPA